MFSKKQKQEIIDNLTDKLNRQKAVIFFDYTGLGVNKFQQLREKLRKENIDCQAAKKTLIDLALDRAGLKKMKVRDLAGQLALVFGYQDEILPAKILYNFAKENKAVKMLAAIVQGEFLAGQAINDLAQLPSQQELLAKLVGAIAAPLTGLINVCQWNLNKLIFILKNLKPEN